MAEMKTKQTEQDVVTYLKNVEDDKRRADCFTFLELMKRVTGQEPKIWGGSIVGFGAYHYKYPSGHEGDWFLTGFAPRKQNMTLYIMAGFDRYAELMSKLGKYKTGKSCLYVKKVEDIDMEVLEDLVKSSVEYIAELYPDGA